MPGGQTRRPAPQYAQQPQARQRPQVDAGAARTQGQLVVVNEVRVGGYRAGWRLMGRLLIDMCPARL